LSIDAKGGEPHLTAVADSGEKQTASVDIAAFKVHLRQKTLSTDVVVHTVALPCPSLGPPEVERTVPISPGFSIESEELRTGEGHSNEGIWYGDKKRSSK
jgi:hypothetical protein